MFNVCETFADDYRMEVNVAALMEMARVKYTGSGTAGLLLAQDKILTKQLLEYHEVPTPDFATFDGETFETNGRLRFPLIVKPARSRRVDRHRQALGGEDWDELTERVRGDPQRAAGRGARRGVHRRPRGLRRRARHADASPRSFPSSSWTSGNWDPERAQGVRPGGEVRPGDGGLARGWSSPQDLSAELQARIERAALLAYRALKLRDYARIDFRISPRPASRTCSRSTPTRTSRRPSELAMAAAEVGLDYAQLVSKILESAAVRYHLHVREAPGKRARAAQS